MRQQRDKLSHFFRKEERKMEKKYIALSFDDGPNETTTGEVLIKLLKHDIVATFFVIGDLINEDTAKMMKNAVSIGCEIENHSKTHSDMSTLTREQIKEEIAYTSEKIENIVGRKPEYFRPPYISVDEQMFEEISLTMVAGYGCEDWVEEVSAKERAKRIVEQIKPGGIILMHDMEGNHLTVEALELLVPELQKRGYEFVTVSQLFERYHVEKEKRVHTVFTNVIGE